MAQKSKTSSCFLGLNVRCLSYHFDEFKVLLASLDQKPDVIALTETWMTVDDDTSDYKLEGYQLIEANPRKKAKRRSGGVAFYTRNDFHFTPVEFVCDIECSIIEVNYNDKDSKLFCVIYRPDTYKPTQFLQQFEICSFFRNPWSTSRSYLATLISTLWKMKQTITDMKTSKCIWPCSTKFRANEGHANI